MTIESDLSDFVRPYFPSDREEKNPFKAQLDQSQLFTLGSRFRRWINQQLLRDDATKENVTKNYRKLAFLFHPDRGSAYLPEVLWLEQQLSEGRMDGTCFKTVGSSYEKLMEPAKFKEIEFSGINSKDDCRRWLEKLKQQSNTFSHRNLCDSLIGLLEESSTFFDSSGTIKPKALKTLIQFIPAIIAGYGTILIMEELLAIYALYFVILKGGKRLAQSDYRELKEVGRSLQTFSGVTAMLSTTLLVRVLELIFWSSRQCLHLTLQIGSAIFPTIMSVPPAAIPEEVNVEELCRELALSSQQETPGMHFSHPELKIIAAPFEKYLALNKQQFFGFLRVGDEKRKMVDAFLFKLRVLDQLPGRIEEKYMEVLAELEALKKNEQVYTCKTAEAVDYIEGIIKVLQSPTVNTECDREDSETGKFALIL